DLLYMPTIDPGLSPGAAASVLQQTDRLLKAVPEVAQVFGKAGRANTATDPAPLGMFETVIQLKPEAEWGPGRDRAAIERDLKQQVTMAGLSNAWTQPIRARIDMLSTGMQSPLGLKFSGPDLAVLADLSQAAAARLAPIAGPAAVYAERSVAGRYLTLDLKDDAAARYGVTSQGITTVLAETLGGRTLGTVIDGRRRTSLRVRLDEHYRSSPEALAALPLTLPSGQRVRLDAIMDLRLESGPAMIKSENALPQSWVFINPGAMATSAFKTQAEDRLRNLDLPPGYSWRWSGRFAEWDRAKARLLQLGALTVVLIALLLWLQSHRLETVVLTLVTLAPACSGALWLSWALGHKWSVALVVGLLALAGLAAEMALLLLSALHRHAQASTEAQTILRQAFEAALERRRAVLMTSSSTALALAPILVSDGAGADLLQRIAAPMLGGLITTVAAVLLLLPALWMMGRNRAGRTGA
ncbi:MAG: efflux RND transporter permease subunit, partial [Pseudomonadales bacterium]